jgi:dipeptidyl aminopeptidase/acylaminoacyl peptidase
MKPAAFRLFAFVCFLLDAICRAEPPRTAAESSDYQKTSSYAEVTAFCEALAKQSSRIRLSTLGTSYEGRKLPLLTIAEPPVASAADATKSSKLVVLAIANIHAGEVDGKEALLMLARDLALNQDQALLDKLAIVIVPILNADGNERLGQHRPEQNGPREVGTRENAQGLDLNRDFLKLETPEVRALVRCFSDWNPAVVIDCHTTNGSHHRYTLTYEGGRCPAGDEPLIDFTRDKLLPLAGHKLEDRTGFKSFFYGNFAADHTRWETILPLPRYMTHYLGLRNRIAVLSESYSYAPFKTRVQATQEFVRAVLKVTADNEKTIRALLPLPSSERRSDGTQARSASDGYRREAVVAGSQATHHTTRIPLRYKPAPQALKTTILGFVEEERDGKRTATTQPRDYEAQYYGATEPTLSVERPYAYLLPASSKKVIENLQRHGLTVDELREDLDLEVEIYKIDQISRGRTFQQHQPVELEATARKESRRIPAGTVLISTAQPLGSLAATLLEPQSADGLTTWNFFDEDLKVGGDFPVLRLPTATSIHTGRVRPLAEDRKLDKPITYDAVYPASGQGLSFAGSPASGQTWLDDGAHYLQSREGGYYKIEARSGRATKHFDPAAIARGLQKLPFINSQAANSLSRRATQNLSPQHDATLLTHNGDLYYIKLNGEGAIRLTHTAGEEELASFSPSGKLVAFVRHNNLYVVDIATQTEIALTSDGSDLVFNGKADWVYYEEVFNRSHRAYWWSPDSSHIAFLQFDDSPVNKFTVVDFATKKPEPESTPYPKAGAANPFAWLGLVSASGGDPKWVDLSNYTSTASLIIRAGWLPDSQKAYCYVQDRAQTWLDVCTVDRDGGEPTKLLRDTTKAWVSDPGEPKYLKDGSFLLFSERTGWKHLYHFSADGTLIGPVTSGDWEARTLHTVDEDAGWIYFSGTRDSHLASNLYRVQLDGSRLERLTDSPGDHRCLVSPKCNLFIDSHSDHTGPTQVHLRTADGTLVRTLDTNPVYTLEEYRRGHYELVKIPADGGVTLEGSLLLPPDFDPSRKYPVWFTTYGGPHAPTISDTWGGGRIRDELLAQMGFVIFRADPHSASGQGECSTWTAYRRFGVPELKDVETAIEWLKQKPFIDGERIGMSGYSYGGFLTAFCLTHSKLFAAGIAGAPVTDWHYYDSIYTERYMNTPQENPKGYEETSVVKAAKNLHGKLLIVHGLIDDNVHVQNSLQLIDALQKADKDFEIMFYPHSRHSITERHFGRLQVEFMKRALKVSP